MKAYLANGLFSQADQMFNRYIANRVREAFPNINLYLPQENEGINDKAAYADSVMIFDGDNKYLDKADLLIAVIDGIEIDSGVASEIGRFLLMKENDDRECYVYALYTDTRQQGRENTSKIDALVSDGTENQFMYRNLYVIGGIKKHGKIVGSVDELIQEITKLVS